MPPMHFHASLYDRWNHPCMCFLIRQTTEKRGLLPLASTTTNAMALCHLATLLLVLLAATNALTPDGKALLAFKVLNLSSNVLNGLLPDSILKCRRLQMLMLARNNLTGLLPLGFGRELAALERLDLLHNRFTGAVPEDFGNLT
jgi:hypothetical protein